VVVHDDVPRSRWQLAIIEELIKGLDGGIRAAKIRTANGKTNRSVTKLFPLEVNDVSETSGKSVDDNTNEHNDDEDTSTNVSEGMIGENSLGRLLPELVSVSGDGLMYYPWPRKMSLIDWTPVMLLLLCNRLGMY